MYCIAHKAKIKNSPVSCLLGQNFRVGRSEKGFFFLINNLIFILFLAETLSNDKTYHCSFTLYCHFGNFFYSKRSSNHWKSVNFGINRTSFFCSTLKYSTCNGSKKDRFKKFLIMPIKSLGSGA